MKKTWAEYLQKIWKLPAAFGTCAVLLAVVFFLYDIAVEPVIYGTALCSAAGLVCLFGGYYRYKNKKERLLNLQANLPVGIEELPEPEDKNEALYQEMLWELNRKRMCAEAGKRRIYEEVTDYYTMWAHQIKTPIAAMRLLLQENPEENQDELGELFKIEQYVEMVLGYLRAEDMSSDMNFQNVELDDVIREQVRKYARIFIGRKISLDFTETGETVLTDRKWLGFVIGQLLSNALKYTKTGKISIYMKTPDDTKTTEEQVLVIEDTGIGISASDLSRVFEKGFTGYNGRGEGGSTGIGLYLCARVMKRLGNRISIESEQGKGTKVMLELKRDELELM